MSIGVIIPAAGVGRRFGSALPKQFQPLNGVPIIVHAIRVFETTQLPIQVVVAVSEEYILTMQNLVATYGLKNVAAIVPGGAERSQTIAKAIHHPALQQATVLAVHDAVRPFHTFELFKTLVQTAKEHGSAIPCVPLTDTIKEVRDGIVSRTIPREKLRAAQTPQVFDAHLLRDCYSKLSEIDGRITDDASVLELCGIQPHVVEGLAENVKITTQHDFDVAQFVLHKRDV